VLRYVQGTWGSWLRKLTLTAVIRHLVENDTAYFTASPGDETILMIDIDCAPDVSGFSLATGANPGNLVGNVVRPWPFGRPPYLGGTLMESVTHRQESSPDNAGHWQSSVALEVLIGRVCTPEVPRPSPVRDGWGHHVDNVRVNRGCLASHRI
jgi:hypothetical protein